MLKNEKDHEEDDEAVSLTKEFNNTNKKSPYFFFFLKLKKAKFVFKAGLLYHHLSPKISTKMY